MSSRKTDSIKLNNGLTLNLYDASRKVASDRWQVKLEAKIKITVTEDYFNDKTPMPAAMDLLHAKLDDQTTYTYQAERNFVDEKNKETIFREMRASLLAKKPYYDHPDFAARFIITEFARQRNLPDIAV